MCKQGNANLRRIDPLVGLVEDNVGGLVKSPERALQQDEGLATCKHHMALKHETGGNWAIGGSLAYHNVAAIVGDDGDDLCGSRRRTSSVRKRGSGRKMSRQVAWELVGNLRSTSDSSAGPPEAICAADRGD